MYLVGSKLYPMKASIIQDGKNAVPTKGFHTISVESGNDSQRRLWTLVCMYFVDVDFYGLRDNLPYFRQIVHGKLLVMANDLCHLGILEWVYQEEDGVHNGESGEDKLIPESTQLFLRGCLTNVSPLYRQ